MEKNDIDKLTKELLKKSLQQPAKINFNDELMENIVRLPQHDTNVVRKNLLNNGWKSLLLALGLFICTISIIAYLSSDISPTVEKHLVVLRNYILYGGMALFVPLLFTQFDELLNLIFRKRFQTHAG
jgi:hypothetical protein